MRHHLRIEQHVLASADRMSPILATGEGQTRWAKGLFTSFTDRHARYATYLA